MTEEYNLQDLKAKEKQIKELIWNQQRKLAAKDLAAKTVLLQDIPENPFGYIYVITRISTGQTYTGQHQAKGLDNYCCSSKVKRFWRTLMKHPEDFKREIIFWVEESSEAMDILNIAETFCIIAYCSYRDYGGYNYTFGGDGCLGRRVTKATKDKLSKANKETWSNQEFRGFFCGIMKEAHNRPDVIEKHKATATAQWEDPDIRAKNEAGIKEAMNRPEVLEATRLRKIEEWSDPEYKDIASKGMSSAWKNRRGYDVIKCIEDNKEFKSSREASKCYDVAKNMIMASVKTGQDVIKIHKTFAAFKDGERVYFPEYNPVRPKRVYSEEAKSNMSKAHLGQVAWNKGLTGVGNIKSVICKETGITYNSVKEAGLANNINAGSITRCCKGKLKSSGGYHWEYY